MYSPNAKSHFCRCATTRGGGLCMRVERIAWPGETDRRCGHFLHETVPQSALPLSCNKQNTGPEDLRLEREVIAIESRMAASDPFDMT